MFASISCSLALPRVLKVFLLDKCEDWRLRGLRGAGCKLLRRRKQDNEEPQSTSKSDLDDTISFDDRKWLLSACSCVCVLKERREREERDQSGDRTYGGPPASKPARLDFSRSDYLAG